MKWDVVDVVPLGNRALQVRFEDGLLGTFSLPATFCTIKGR